MFRKILRAFAPMVSLYAAIGVACAGLGALSVWLFQRLVDLLTGGRAQALPLTLLLYGLVALLELLANYADNYPYNQLKQGLYQHIRRMALAKMQTIDYTAWQDTGTGTLIQMVENGAAAGRNILFDFYLRIFVELLPGALLSLLLMGAYDRRVMAAVLCGYVLVFIITRLLLGKLYAVKEKTLVSEEFLSRTYVRAFMELVTFRVNRRFQAELSKASRAGQEITQAHTRIRMVHELFFTAFAIIVLVIKVAVIAFSAAAVLRGDTTVGVLLALLTLTDRVYQPIAIFNVLYVDYKLDMVAWKRFEGFLNAPDDPGLLDGAAFVPGKGSLALRGVSFRYGGAELLRDVTLDIEGGQQVALVGKSGSGKTTLVKLMMGLLRPDAGQVLADGQDLAGLALDSYYQHIAYLSQETPIFDGTLRENICFDAPAADEQLRAVLDRAQLTGLLQTLPGGLDTRVGERGIKLSGGERQRVAFARALYTKPVAIILDEPTSALDHETERALLREMREAFAGTTVVSIAHRLSTIQDASRIIVIGDGGVLEEGTHEALLAQGGAYAALARAGDEG